jgi:hypothetical protein
MKMALIRATVAEQLESEKVNIFTSVHKIAKSDY